MFYGMILGKGFMASLYENLTGKDASNSPLNRSLRGAKDMHQEIMTKIEDILAQLHALRGHL
jgi:hypothetical protein